MKVAKALVTSLKNKLTKPWEEMAPEDIAEDIAAPVSTGE